MLKPAILFVLLLHNTLCDSIAESEADEANKAKVKRDIWGTLIRRNTTEYIINNALHQGEEYKLENFIQTIQKSFLNQSSRYNEKYKEAREYIRKRMYDSNFTVLICGQVMTQHHKYVAIPFFDYMSFERETYEKVPVNETVRIKFTKNPRSNLNMLMTFELINKMNVKIIRKIMINVVDAFFGLRIHRIEYSGACLDSQNMDKNYVSSTWESKNDPGTKSVTAGEFMEIVIDKFPFSEKFDSKMFATHFFAQKHHYARLLYIFKHDIERYMKDFTASHIIHNDLTVLPISDDLKVEAEKLNKDTKAQTNIIVESKDHIVFRISRIFEKAKNPNVMELWNFQIESIYNVDNDEQWKITKMFINHPLDQFNVTFPEFYLDFTENFVEGMRRDIVNVAKNHDQNIEIEKNLIRRIKNVIIHDDKVMTPSIANVNTSERVLKMFRPTSGLELLDCQTEITEQNEDLDNSRTVLFDLHFKVICKYNDNWNNHKTVVADFLGTYRDTAEVIDINQIEIKIPYQVGIGFRNIPIKYKTKVELAEKIYKLVLGQSSIEHEYWKESVENLTSYMKNERFRYTICGHQNNSLDGFNNYLDRSRRKYKTLERTPIFDILSYTPKMIIKLEFIFTNVMHFMMKEIYHITVEGGMYTKLKIAHFEVKGSCINYDSFDKNSIYPAKLKSSNTGNGDSAKQFIDKVQNSLINSLEDEEFDENDYSQNFEAIVESNPNTNETYSLDDFEEYIKRFSVNKKLQQNHYEGNPIKTTIILEEYDHFVVKFTMVFESFIGIKNESIQDEWIFVIEASYKNQWKIEKIVMTPPHNLLGNDEIPRRAADAYMTSVDENYKTILRKLENIPYVPRADQKNMADCRNMTYNFTTTDTVYFVEKLISFFKEGNLTERIVTVTSKNWKVDAFSFKIWYVYGIDNVQKLIVVDHHVIYNYKFNYYRETKMELLCPVVMKDVYN